MKALTDRLHHQIRVLRRIHRELMRLGYQAEAHTALGLAERTAGLHERLLGHMRRRETYELDPEPTSLADLELDRAPPPLLPPAGVPYS